WAETAWERVQHDDPGHPYTEDYAQGFKDGFVSYMARGGTGEPPFLPPPKYRSLRNQTAAGYQAAEDWFAGYRPALALVRARGYGRGVTGAPILDCPGPAPAPAPVAPPPGLAPVPPSPPASGPPRKLPEELPSPKKVESEARDEPPPGWRAIGEKNPSSQE